MLSSRQEVDDATYREIAITKDWIESRCGWTPYDGVEVTGWPIGTIIRGNQVMWEGEIPGPPAGEPVRFMETL